ncbi:MAG: hypothetical protein K0R48_723 [Gammaproteobacteria bacterium]|jgi:hypothetical protein|nr:hypothetical protein [Gammaproteobacteria bacterium]
MVPFSDIVIYLTNRFEHNNKEVIKWHEIEAQKVWDIKANHGIFNSNLALI